MKWENRLGCKHLSIESGLHGAMQTISDTQQRFLVASLKQSLWQAVRVIGCSPPVLWGDEGAS